MKTQTNINVNVVEPLNWDELNSRYAEAVFMVIKNKVPIYLIEEFIENLKAETNFHDDAYRRDSNEDSSHLQQKVKDN